MTHFPRALAVTVIAVTFVTAALEFGERYDARRQGLAATYFGDAAWTMPAFSVASDYPATDQIARRWQGAPPPVFSVTWTGVVVALREGTYTFATVSDDGSWVFVDGAPVVDNGGEHGALEKSGSIHLSRGAHPLTIRYFQNGGGFQFQLLWARNGSRLAAVPAWALRTRTGRGPVAVAASVIGSVALLGMAWLWVALVGLALAVLVAKGLRRLQRVVASQCAWGALRWVLVGSLALNVVGLWWGLPGLWAPIELLPSYILGGLAIHYSHGWFDAYPPLQFYILSVAMTPQLFLHWMGLISLGNAASDVTLMVIFRLIGVAAGVGTVVATCLIGTRMFGRRAGVFAALVVALTTPFVYYSKTANVDGPYLFWFALSMVFYVRFLDGIRLRDLCWFAIAGILSICTKDQAYGLYLLAPVFIVYALSQEHRRAGEPHALWRALTDRRLLVATTAAVLIFVVCHNFLFNFDGFEAHVRYITGPGSESYRTFEHSVAGHLALLRRSALLLEESMGWPLLVTCLAGVGVALTTARSRRALLWLAAPVVSYYLGFINVVLYDYDRFMLPICVLLALFGGLALDVLLAAGARRSWRIGAVAVVAAIFGYTLLYAATVDALMLTDSRYAVQAWLGARTAPDAIIGVSGLPENSPFFGDGRTADVGTVETLALHHPEYVVLNVDYARAVPTDTDWGQLIVGLEQETLGYRLVRQFRSPSPWPWLPGAHPDLVGPRLEPLVWSVLRDINPTMDVFQCVEARCGVSPGH